MRTRVRRTPLTSCVIRARSGLALVCLLPVLGACGSSGGGKDGPDGLALTDDNNYWSKTDLTIPTIQTVAGETDFEVCWSEVVDDLQCHEIDPEETIIKVSFLQFVDKDKQEVTEILNSGIRPDVGTYLEYDPSGSDTCMNFTDLHNLNDPKKLDPEDIFARYEETEDNTYLMTFSSSTTAGAGTKTMVFIEPSSDSDNTMVMAPTACGDDPLLAYEVDIAGSDPLEIPVDGPWVVDWRGVTTDSVGNDMPYEFVDRILLGYYEGYDVAQIEDEIYDIETIGELWEIVFDEDAESVPRSADLADVKPVGDAPEFDGFDRQDGTWLLALMCSSCSSPAPLVLTVLEPTDGDG